MGHGGSGSVPVQTTCSESGITLQFGKHKGRLIMPARVQPPMSSNDQEWWPYSYNGHLSETEERHGEQADRCRAGRANAGELSTGSIYYNSRSHMSVDHRRQIAWATTAARCGSIGR